MTDLPSERPARVVEEFERSPYSRRDTLLTMFGVLMVMLLGSLDQTIVATALPHVIADLHGFNEYTWVSTAYLLTSTVTVPIYGKLSDLFGRKPIFLFGIVLFLGGVRTFRRVTVDEPVDCLPCVPGAWHRCANTYRRSSGW